jgi:hypothetical protein
VICNVFFFFNSGDSWEYCCFSTGLAGFWVGISAAYFLFFLVLLLSRISFKKKDLHSGPMMFFQAYYSDKYNRNSL